MKLWSKSIVWGCARLCFKSVVILWIIAGENNPPSYLHHTVKVLQPLLNLSYYASNLILGLLYVGGQSRWDSKLYIRSTLKTQMNLMPFCFWADWAVRAVLKISSVLLLSILLLEVFLLYFHGQNKYKNRVSVCCIVHTKTLIYKRENFNFLLQSVTLGSK